MSVQRVSLKFRRKPDDDLYTFGKAIITGLTNNPAFSDPPVTMIELTTLNEAFGQATSDVLLGGRVATARKTKARQALLVALRTLARYVETEGGDDPVTMITTNFTLMSKNQTPTELGVPGTPTVKYGPTTQLLLTFKGVPNARGYEIEMSLDGTTWVHAVFSTRTRGVVVGSLTPGTVYYFRVRAMGGKNGHGAWTSPVQCMAV
jgi:hypothetical protein